MRFAYFSASPIMQYGLMTGFEDNGHETKLFPMACMGDHKVTIEQNGKPVSVSYLEQDLISTYIDRCIDEYKPDYVVLEGYQGELATGIIPACRKYGCGFIYWSIEDPVGFNQTLAVAKSADIVFTTSVECIPEYQKRGIEAHLLMFGCNPDYHRSGVFKAHYDLDFAVQASWYNFEARVQGFNTLLKPLLNLGLNYRIWGYNWGDDPAARSFLGEAGPQFAGVLPNSELPDLCASSKIILGFQCDSSSITQTSMRNFEVLSCGGFYLCQFTKASAYVFQEGVHLELVRDEEEAVEKVRYYLANEHKRKKIALQGQAYVRSKHTYAARVRENILPNILPEKRSIAINNPKESPIGYKQVRKCPLCESEDLRIFSQYLGMTLLKCQQCELTFRDNGHDSETTELIQETYSANWVSMREKYMEDTFLQHACFNVLLLEMFCSEKGDLLEIGSGTGEFLYMAKDAGWKAAGIEPSEEACAYALKKFGVRLVNQTWKSRLSELEENFDQNRKYDAVVFWHVLEHIPDPLHFLKEVSLILKPKGKIFFSIPNGDSFTNFIFGPFSPLYLEADHLFHYNRQNLKLLLNKAKLKPVSLFSREEYQQMKMDLNAYLRKTKRSGKIAIEDTMGIMARLQAQNQGHELFCVAEKQS